MKDMAFKFLSNKMNKRGLSGIIIMMVMIALVLATAVIVINLTKKTVEGKIEQAEACGINILDKFSINGEYVCYDSASDEFVFSINRGDIDLDKLLISISTETESQTFEMRAGTSENFGGKILSYPDRVETVRLSAKNSGRTYIVTEFGGVPVKIEIAPVISGNQCGVVDTLSNIVDCSLTTILS